MVLDHGTGHYGAQAGRATSAGAPQCYTHPGRGIHLRGGDAQDPPGSERVSALGGIRSLASRPRGRGASLRRALEKSIDRGSAVRSSDTSNEVWLRTWNSGP